MWQRDFSSKKGGQGLVDIRERLVHLLVFYYNIIKNCYQFSLKLNTRIYQILHIFVYFVLLKSTLILPPQEQASKFVDRGVGWGGGRGGQDLARRRYCRKKLLMVKDHYKLCMRIVINVYNQSIIKLISITCRETSVTPPCVWVNAEIRIAPFAALFDVCKNKKN